MKIIVRASLFCIMAVAHIAVFAIGGARHVPGLDSRFGEREPSPTQSWMTWAAGNGLRPLVQLLAYTSNVDEPDEHGRTALQEAASNGHARTVRALLDCGASLSDHQIPRFRLSYNGIPSLRSGVIDVLKEAVRGGHAEIVSMLLQAGVMSDRELLSTAAKRGNSAIVEVLLRYPQWAQAVNVPRYGETPLMSAVKGGHHAVAQELLKAGANPNCTQYFSASIVTLAPLHRALESKDAKMVKILLLGGANPWLKRVEGAGAARIEISPVMAAAKGDIDSLAHMAFHGVLIPQRVLMRLGEVPRRRIVLCMESYDDAIFDQWGPQDLRRLIREFAGQLAS